MVNVVLVDDKDNQIGVEDKLKAHTGKGSLHRCISVFVFNDKKQLLLQKRGKEKMLWPLYWTNTCCSHPAESEGYEQAGQRRLEEEMGFSCLVKFIGKMQYEATYKDIGVEKEVCGVVVGKYNGEVNVNPSEADDYKWIDMDELKEDVKNNSDKYTPWFKLYLEKFFKDSDATKRN